MTKTASIERLVPVTYLKAGRLVPPQATGLRAAVVVLRPGEIMPWHSTREREELLILMTGRVTLEMRRQGGRGRLQKMLKAGESLFLPRRTPHRVVNRSRADASYIYVTGSAHTDRPDRDKRAEGRGSR